MTSTAISLALQFFSSSLSSLYSSRALSTALTLFPQLFQFPNRSKAVSTGHQLSLHLVVQHNSFLFSSKLAWKLYSYLHCSRAHISLHSSTGLSTALQLSLQLHSSFNAFQLSLQLNSCKGAPQLAHQGTTACTGLLARMGLHSLHRALQITWGSTRTVEVLTNFVSKAPKKTYTCMSSK